MRKETSNQFTEGLVSDLNPINTPNTVLTDNLNGTLITYNGNEFSLQNDQGNYELKNCRLNPNYVPVGIKEYGDILYIVSYNPITEKVQIGSYPSPLDYDSSEGEPGDRIIESAIKKLSEEKNTKELKYSELSEVLDGVIFNEEKFKLNPGDQYKLTRTGEWDYFYENIDYKIMNDESYYQDVTNLIKINQKNYEYVPWTTPGFLAINSVLADIKIHGLNIKYFYIDEDEIGQKFFHFSFTTQLNVEDKHLKNLIKTWIDQINSTDEPLYNISFDFSIFEKHEIDSFTIKRKLFSESISFFKNTLFEGKHSLKYPYKVESGKHGYSEWYDEYVYLWKTIKGEFQTANFDRTIVVEITPVFHDKDDIKIKFDNLTQTLEFNLSEAENGTYILGDELFKFKVDPETKIETIAFNTKGPLVSESPPQLYYRLYGFYTKKESEWKSLGFESGFGIQNEVIHTIELDNDILGVEDAGYIEFKITTGAGNKFLGKRIVVTSEYINKFYDDKSKLIFDRDIALKDWICEYFKEFKLDYNIYDPIQIYDTDFKKDNGKYYSQNLEKFYNGNLGFSFFTEADKPNTHCYRIYNKYSIDNISVNGKKDGRLWEGTRVDHFSTNNIGGYSVLNQHSLYNGEKLVCDFKQHGDSFDFYPDVDFIELEPKIDTLDISLQGTCINTKFTSKDCNPIEWEQSNCYDSDDYFYDDASKSLEGFIWKNGLYDSTTTKSSVVPPSTEKDPNLDNNNPDEQPGRDEIEGNESESPGSSGTGGASTIPVVYIEPNILDRFVPCRLLKVNLSLTASNNCRLRFGAIIPSPLDIGPYDIDTSLLNYSEDISTKKTFYFLMFWSGEIKLVDGGKRNTGAYVLVPFDKDLIDVERLYKEKFCKKLIQSRCKSDVKESKCNCYMIEYEQKSIDLNMVTWTAIYSFNINYDYDGKDVMYTNILKGDKPLTIGNDNHIKYINTTSFTIDNLTSPDVDFTNDESIINSLNNKALTEYNSWQENPFTDLGKPTQDNWICLDKSLKNDSLKAEITRNISRDYDGYNRLVGYTNTDPGTQPDRVKLKPTDKSWMCARVAKGDGKINGRGKKNFIVIGTVWKQDGYEINSTNWLNENGI